MKKIDVIAGIFLTIIGLLCLFVIIPNQTTEADEYGLSPAFFPMVLMGVITLMAVFLLIARFRQNKDADGSGSPLGAQNLIFVHGVCAFLFLSLGVMKYLGYIAGGIVVISGSMFYLGTRSPIKIALVSILSPVVFYLLIRQFLGVIL